MVLVRIKTDFFEFTVDEFKKAKFHIDTRKTYFLPHGPHKIHKKLGKNEAKPVIIPNGYEVKKA